MQGRPSLSNFHPTDYMRIERLKGLLEINRQIFVDPDIFELEMRHIFEATWIFLGLESQIPKPHDFLATQIGRKPVLVMRDGAGVVRGFFNTCRHRGALLCHVEAGNRKYHVCPYHGWSYGSEGRNFQVTDRSHGFYPDSFQDRDRNLLPLPKFATYRGLMFGCLDLDVPELEDWLGEARFFVDLVMEQGPHGMEFVPGRNTWTFKANWKLQIDNSDDCYHLLPTHRSFTDILDRRSASGQYEVEMPSFDERSASDAGTYTFPYGHTLTWIGNKTPANRPLYRTIDEVRQRVGEKRARWMLQNRNMNLYPSVQLCDSTSLIIRTIRPIAADKTEMQLWSLAPIGEDPEGREYRIRQHEDFFGAAGLANPDDNAVYEDCQAGYETPSTHWLHAFERGVGVLQQGPDARARELGFTPETSVSGTYRLCDETVCHSGYREWFRLMSRASNSPMERPDGNRRSSAA